MFKGEKGKNAPRMTGRWGRVERTRIGSCQGKREDECPGRRDVEGGKTDLVRAGPGGRTLQKERHKREKKEEALMWVR